MLLLLVVVVAVATGAAAGAPLESRREHITKLAAQIKRADYEGDRAALKRLYQELAPFADDKELGTRVRYWRGFAMWRRALNGFNDSADPSELEQSLKQAISEFQEAMTKDPAFIDAKSSAGSCMALLMFLYGKNPALAPEFNDANRRREFLLKALSYMNEAEAEEPKNPRVLWVLGPVRWNLPLERGGGQDKAIETYQNGLAAARAGSCKSAPSNALIPKWGEPELLMSLAWSNLNRSTPDVSAAEQYARSALALVPYWHYVRDILVPQIEAARKKQQATIR